MSARDHRESHDAAEHAQPSSSNRIWLDVAILASSAGAEPRPIGERGRAPLWTVLIIARDADMRADIQECLAEARLCLVAAADLESGIEALAAVRPDLLVLDASAYRPLGRGAPSGDELTDVPVLLLADEAPAAGTTPQFDDRAHATVVVRPFNARRLREEVARCLARSPQR